MLTPSPETLKIRNMVEALTDDDLKKTGPGDFREPVEGAGMAFKEVRDKVNNELARERRKRGIRKGRGRRVSLDYSVIKDKEERSAFRRFLKLTEFCEQFKSMGEARQVIEKVIGFIEGFGSKESLLAAVEILQEEEKAAKHPGRGKNVR